MLFIRYELTSTTEKSTNGPLVTAAAIVYNYKDSKRVVMCLISYASLVDHLILWT